MIAGPSPSSPLGVARQTPRESLRPSPARRPLYDALPASRRASKPCNPQVTWGVSRSIGSGYVTGSFVETDVWERIKIPEPGTPHNELERPFTDEEVRKLLTGPASPPMHDLMMIAALTGARLRPSWTRARDCEAGLLRSSRRRRRSPPEASPSIPRRRRPDTRRATPGLR